MISIFPVDSFNFWSSSYLGPLFPLVIMLRFFVVGASLVAAASCQFSSMTASNTGSSRSANLSNSVDLALLPICAVGIDSKFVKASADIPKQNCLGAAIIQGTTSPCEQGDIKCLCGNANYTNALYCCVRSSCSTSDQNSKLSYTFLEVDSYRLCCRSRYTHSGPLRSG